MVFWTLLALSSGALSQVSEIHFLARAVFQYLILNFCAFRGRVAVGIAKIHFLEPSSRGQLSACPTAAARALPRAVGERAKPGREGVSVALSPLHQPKQNIKRTGGENHAPKVFWGSFMAERGLLGYLAAILLRGRCAILLSTFSHGVPNWATPPKGCPV